MLIDAAGGEPRLLVASFDNPAEPSWSPDGSMVAYVDNTFGTSDIFIVDPDDGTRVNVTNSPAYENSPSWSVAAP
jgi:Tol biopolymer transport system component